MAQAQIQLKPYSGLEKESFREFEHLLRSYLAVAGIANAQQANFLQLHLRDAALRFFQTLPDATRADLDLSLTALRDRFCNPHLQELHVLNLENLKFDSKTDTPENFLVTLQTKALKAYPDPTLVPIAPIDGAAPDAAVEQTRFDQETARNAEQLRSAQEARSIQIRRQFIKNMPGWLRAKLLEQPETTSVEDLCIFARKQLTIHNLFKIDDSPMDAFSEIGPTVTDTLVTALTKLSTSQEALDNRLNEMSKKFEERNNALSNQLENVQKLQRMFPIIKIHNLNAALLVTHAVKILKIVVTAAVIVDATAETMAEVTAAIAQIFNVNHGVSDHVTNHIIQITKISIIKAGKILSLIRDNLRSLHLMWIHNSPHLKCLRRILTICRTLSKVVLRVISAAIRTIWHLIVQWWVPHRDEVPRCPLISIKKTKYAAQATRAHKQARHM